MGDSLPISDPISERDRLILDEIPRVRIIARRVHERLPSHVDLEDLVSDGMLGLLNAVDGFDPGKGTFKTYAACKILGSILDSLRRADWASRGTRKTSKAISIARDELGMLLQRTPTEEEIAEHLGIPVEDLRENAAAMSLEPRPVSALRPAYSDLPEPEIPCPKSQWPDSALVTGEVGALLKAVGQSLPPRCWLILLLHYWEEMGFEEIGALLEISQSRASQLHDAALNQLSGALYSKGLVRMCQLTD